MSEDKEISTNLTINDLKIINNIIDFASSKGLIKPVDFTIVGQVYEKINSIIKLNTEDVKQ